MNRNNMKTIDARGLSCPEPVILTRRALESCEDSYKIIVDNHASKENVTRFAEHAGYTVAISENDSEYTLTLKRV